MVRWILSVGLCLLLGMPVWAQPDRGARIAGKEMVSEQRVALVIGNGAYASSPLRNPANDARAMRKALADCGFTVIEKIDCGRREMYEAIRDFGSAIQKGGDGYGGERVGVDFISAREGRELARVVRRFVV